MRGAVRTQVACGLAVPGQRIHGDALRKGRMGVVAVIAQFQDQALRELAREWLEERGIKYTEEDQSGR